MQTSSPLARELVGASHAMVRLRGRIERIAPAPVPVLFTGETGTGKTTAARLLHELSQRGGGPLVKVNCAGVPDTLLESELFGHERGAFTGATQRRVGLLPQADRGSLFLDEIGDLSPAGQAKLLTALDEGEVRPVGGDRPIRVNVRLLSATSRDLDRDIGTGRFRADLFHRIAVVRIHLPALRDRPEDIPSLARTTLRRLAQRHGQPVPELTTEALEYLRVRPWPGNVREFLHLLEAALVLRSGTMSIGRGELEEAAPEREVPGPGG
jgi:DNA-binding NtrC family response regulator